MLHVRDRPALKVIVAYKLCKAAVTALLALVLLRAQLHGHVHALAAGISNALGRLPLLRDEADRMAHWLVHEATGRHVAEVIALLALDTLSTAIEGIGLHKRWRWAAWWVVAATGAFLPLELWGIAHHPTLERALVLLANLAIVAYLLARVLWRHTEVPRPRPPA